MAIKKRVVLHTLLREGKDVWVRNHTGKEPWPKAGPMILSISPDSTDHLVVPAGRDPVCLTDQVDPDTLKSCRDLNKAFRSGVLELLDPDESDAYYAKQQDRKAIMERKVNKYISKAEEAEVADPTKIRKAAAANVHPMLPNLCQKAQRKSISLENMLEKLDENKGALSREDFAYVASRGVYPAIKAWAKECIELFDTDTDDFDNDDFDPVEEEIDNVE